MLHSYKSYTLILESKSRDKKIEKVRDKIKKFANITGIYNWSIDKCTSDNSTEGLQYAVWIANHLKDVIVDGLLSTLSHENVKKERIEKYIAKGPESDKKLEKLIEKEWSDIDSVIIGFQETINDDVNFILDWLKSPLRTELVNLSDLSFSKANDKSKEWHDSLKASGKIIDETGKVFIEFDDGYYWIDLQVSNSRAEADAMGHCGNTNDGDTLLSLRDKNKSPHVTVAYDTKEGIIYQMKGRNNKKPIDKYHPYIYRLLVDPELKPKYFAYEYLKEEDFNMSDFDKETFQKVYKFNPDIVYKSIEYDHKMCKGLIKKGYLDKEDVKDILLKTDNMTVDIIMDLLDTGIFTKDELKELFKNHNIDPGNCTDLMALKLYDEGITDINQLAMKFSDIEIISGKTYLVGDLDDLDNFMSDSVKNILFGEDWFEPGEWYKLERSEDIWDDLTKETKEKVVEKMIGKEISYNYYRDDERNFNGITIEKDMIQWIDKDFYFIYNDEKYEIDKILDENENEDLQELFEALSESLNYAQEDANMNEYYKQAKKSLVNVLGEYEIESRTISSKIHIKVIVFDFHYVCDVSAMVSFLEDIYTYNGKIDWDRENYGPNIWSILNDMIDKKADINDDYGFYGTINKELLNDYVLEQLFDV